MSRLFYLMVLLPITAATCLLAGQEEPSSGPRLLYIEVLAPKDVLEVGESMPLTIRGRDVSGAFHDLIGRPRLHIRAGHSRSGWPDGPGEYVDVDAAGVVTANYPVPNVAILVTYQEPDLRQYFASLRLTVHAAGDRDSDGMPDAYELQYGLDPHYEGDTEIDFDLDFLGQLREYQAGTDPRNADTDGDGYSDALEVNTGKNPLVPDPPQESRFLAPSCWVSLLNRTTRVDAGGGWILPNVPANFAPVRARALCNENGRTREGYSSIFDLDEDAVVEVGNFSFDGGAPIPTSLSLAGTIPEMTTRGQTQNLAASALFADGSRQDVTLSPEIRWQTSNAEIASVDDRGNITAINSGTALISAWLEGALGIFEARVRLSGDADGDGLLDDFEIANGLDPNSPGDAFDDPDGDGLSINDEFRRGLDPFNADTDGDGLLDGFEVIESRTNALLRDSDGDRVSDRLELKAESDPNNRLSVRLGPILQSLKVSPDAFELVFNVIQGEVSRQIEIRGTLEDGTVLDLTDPLYDTLVSSSAPTVALPGLRPGTILAGVAGTAVVTASNGPFSASAQVSVTRFAPTRRGTLVIPGAPNAIALLGDDYALVAAGAGDLQIASITDKDQPAMVASLPLPGYSFGVATRDHLALMAAGNAGLVTVDVSNPLAPRMLGSAPTPTPALDVATFGELAVLVDGTGLRIFDVSSPSAPTLRSSLDLAGKPRDLAIDVERSLAVIAAESAGVLVVSLADPSAPVLLGQTSTRMDLTSDAAGVTLQGAFAYVADGANNLGGLRIVDLTDPTMPFVDRTSTDLFGLVEVDFESGVIIAADYYYVNAALIFDVRSLPVLAFQANGLRDGEGTGIVGQNGFSYLTSYRGPIQSFPVWGQGDLTITELIRVAADDEPSSPPMVDWIAPSTEFTLLERRSINVKGAASDDIGIRAVELFLGGIKIGSDAVPPYELKLAAPSEAGTYPVQLVAFDLAGNRSESRPLNLTVEADDDPVISLLTPTENLPLLEGRPFEVMASATDDISVSYLEILMNGRVIETLRTRPYRTDLVAPAGAPSVAIRVRAYDDLGQVASEEKIIPVLPDQTPVPSLLEPEPDTPLVAGGLLRVSAGIADDYGVPVATLWIDDVAVVEDSSPPYQFSYRVPAGQELKVRVGATDLLGQTSVTPQRILPIIADPGTTVIGRVVAEGDVGVPGSEITCGGITITSGVDGEFMVPDLPSNQLEISCTAEAVLAGQKVFGSARAQPISGGLTVIGELVLRPAGGTLFYVAADLLSDSSNVFLLEGPGSTPHPWIRIPGLRDLVLTPNDRLLAHTSGFEGSYFYEIDPDTGETVQGPIPALDAEGYGHSYDRIAFDPVRQKPLGLNLAIGKVEIIDLETASYPALVTDLSLDSAAMAFAEDGLLYILGIAGQPGGGGGVFLTTKESEPSLQWIQIDPQNGAVITITPLSVAFSPTKVGALAPYGAGRFLAVVDDRVLIIDSNGEATCFTDCRPSLAAEALVPRQIPSSPYSTTVSGRVVDVGGNGLPGMTVAAFGGFSSTSDANGVFTLNGVSSVLARLRVTAADPFGLSSSSELNTVVAGGITNIGDLLWNHISCVSGQVLLGGDCDGRPFAGQVEVAFGPPQGPFLRWRPLETGLDGSFCSLLSVRYSTELMVSASCGCPSGQPAICRETMEEVDHDFMGSLCGSNSCDQVGDVILYCECQ